MIYKKFKTDDNDCINVKTYSLLSESKVILMTQLITDGNIDENNATTSLRKIEETSIDYLSEDTIKKIKQHQKGFTLGIVKEMKIEHPSYCIFTIYELDGKNWILLDRTIITNKKNKLLKDLNIIKNIPYLESDYILSSKPDELIPKQKILKRQELSNNR